MYVNYNYASPKSLAKSKQVKKIYLYIVYRTIYCPHRDAQLLNKSGNALP